MHHCVFIELNFVRKHIAKLEMALKHCHREIKKLEESEVDFDAEEDSSYLKVARFRQRCVKIYKKIARKSEVFVCQ